MRPSWIESRGYTYWERPVAAKMERMEKQAQGLRGKRAMAIHSDGEGEGWKRWDRDQVVMVAWII